MTDPHAMFVVSLYIDKYFVTTHPDEIKTKISKNKMNFLPIPVDENIENLQIYNRKYY